MSRINPRNIPIVGVVAAIGLLAISAYQYSGNMHWTRVTVSLLCASTLPDGSPNPGRELPITALLLLCASMALLFHFISQLAETRVQHNAIQIGGIGSMVYALLTATPMHNLMVNIALVFFIVAIVAIIYMLYRKQYYMLTILGAACIVVKSGSVSLYYTNTYTEVWGVLQKLSIILTTTWLFAVHMTVKLRVDRDITNGCTKVADAAEIEGEITPATR